MTPRVLTDPPAPGTDEWRRTISASKIPGILGISRFTSQFRVWHEMAGTIAPEQLDPERMAWGHIAEQSLAEWWKHHHAGWQLNQAGEVTYTNPDLPFPNLATLDRRARRGRAFHIVECKTAHDLDDWGKPGEEDSIPADYHAQVMWQMGVSGIHDASIVVLAYGAPEIHPVEWNPNMFDGLVQVATEWWDSLQAGDPPPLDDSVATYDAVRALHPDIDKGTEVQISHEEADDFLDRILHADQAEKDARAAKTWALDRLGTAHKLMAGDVKIADRRANSRGTVSLYPNKRAQLGAAA